LSSQWHIHELFSYKNEQLSDQTQIAAPEVGQKYDSEVHVVCFKIGVTMPAFQQSGKLVEKCSY